MKTERRTHNGDTGPGQKRGDNENDGDDVCATDNANCDDTGDDADDDDKHSQPGRNSPTRVTYFTSVHNTMALAMPPTAVVNPILKYSLARAGVANIHNRLHD